MTESLAKVLVERDQVVKRIGELEEAIDEAEEGHRAALQEHELAEVERLLVQDRLEAQRFALIEAALPTQDEVLRYLSARVAVDEACSVCGQAGGDIEAHLAGSSCFLCGLPISRDEVDEPEPAEFLEALSAQADKAVAGNLERLAERAEALAELQASLALERSRRAELDGRAKALRAKLPSGSTDLSQSSRMIEDLEDDLEVLRLEVEESRSTLASVIDRGNSAVRARQDEIKAVFDEVATRFLVEQCHLVPHQTSLRIGQDGSRFPVQGFDLNLGSATELGESRRESGDAVSESQRVFVDIAFRIALIHTCVGLSAGTIVIDAPEGSLDAVFSSNAAALLFSFVSLPKADNRLVVASNLIEGSLLPELARLADVQELDDPRLINLIEIAAPTAAVQNRGDEYREVLAKALAPARAGGGV